MKTSHFEERIALRVVTTAHGRDESTQCELATFDNDLGSAWLVSPADCARTGHPPRNGRTPFAIGRFKTAQCAHRRSPRPHGKPSHSAPRLRSGFGFKTGHS